MPDKPALRITTGAHTPFLLEAAVTPGTGLAGIRLILQDNLNPFGLSLVGELSPQLSVRPLAHLLLRFAVESLPIRHISHITDNCLKL